MKFVNQMFLCKHFDDLDLTNWEQNQDADKTYANAKMHFMTKYKEKKLYPKTTARQLGYMNQAKDAKRL